MRRAELEWVKNVVHDIEDGKLWLTKEQMEAVGREFENRSEGGEAR
jgi:hypothetical protein